MALPKKEAQTIGGGMDEAERQMLIMAGLLGERSGHLSELTRLKDPSKLRTAINEVSATMVGLPSSKAWDSVTIPSFDKGEVAFNSYVTETVTDLELMQIFMSPDYMANKRGAGYYAEAALDNALAGTTRDEVLTGVTGPGRYNKEEATAMATTAIDQNLLLPDNAEKAIGQLTGALRREALEVAHVIIDEAPRYNARKNIWEAFGNHQQTCGDEKSGSQLFVTPGHSAPQGPDWQVFFSGDENRRDKALRQIYAMGLTYDELVSQGKSDLLVEGIHYKFGGDGGNETIKLKGNVYAEGFTTENFKSWIGAVLNVTGGDLLAAYDAWYTAITTGLVAKVAIKGVNVGDPPIVSGLDAWLMHFREKQLAEAGKDEAGNIKKYNLYRNKTGPSVSIGKYQSGWIESFFDSAALGQDGDTVFNQWWNKDVPMGEIPWTVTDMVQGSEEEVRLSSFDGWLYKKFQLFKLLDGIQNTPPLKDICAYTYWQGMARTLDKAFSAVFIPDTSANRRKASLNGVTSSEMEVVTREGTAFIKSVPDNDNPRYQMFIGLLTKYAPVGTLKKEYDNTSSPVYWDAGLSPNQDRFTTASEVELAKAFDPKALQKSMPGSASLESFVTAYVNGGMLSAKQAKKAMEEVYSSTAIENKILKQSEELRNLLEDK